MAVKTRLNFRDHSSNRKNTNTRLELAKFKKKIIIFAVNTAVFTTGLENTSLGDLLSEIYITLFAETE